jgi:hypothetical protein
MGRTVGTLVEVCVRDTANVHAVVFVLTNLSYFHDQRGGSLTKFE